MTQTSTQRDPTVAGLLRLLDLLPGEGEGRFVGPRRPGGVGRVFGGQVIGQSLVAATRTVPEDRPCHSLHCYFMRPASEEYAIDFRVEADMDGGAFSNRRVVASQQGKPIFNMIASFQRREAGFSHQVEMPQVPPPEALPPFEGFFRDGSPQGPEHDGIKPVKLKPIELRLVDPLIAAGGPAQAPRASCWLRIEGGRLGIDQSVQRAILGLMSDLLLLTTAYRPHGVGLATVAVQAASIDHALWFHDDVECGDWLLYTTDSPWTGNARGFSRGQIFARDGRLVASVAQEGLMRHKAKVG